MSLNRLQSPAPPDPHSEARPDLSLPLPSPESGLTPFRVTEVTAENWGPQHASALPSQELSSSPPSERWKSSSDHRGPPAGPPSPPAPRTAGVTHLLLQRGGQAYEASPLDVTAAAPPPRLSPLPCAAQGQGAQTPLWAQGPNTLIPRLTGCAPKRGSCGKSLRTKATMAPSYG